MISGRCFGCLDLRIKPANNMRPSLIKLLKFIKLVTSQNITKRIYNLNVQSNTVSPSQD